MVKSTHQGELRLERDRFLAFAFCRADLLLELTEDFLVTFVNGANRSLLHLSAGNINGHNILELIEEEDHKLLEALLTNMVDGARPEPVTVSFLDSQGKRCPLSVTGYFVEDLQRRYFLSCKVPDAITKVQAAQAPLHNPGDFGEIVAERLHHHPEDNLTFIEIKNYNNLLKRLDSDAKQELTRKVNTYLRASSVEANAAAAFGDGRYGLVTSPHQDIEKITSDLSGQFRTADPAGVGLKVESASVELAKAGIAGGDAAQALSFMIRQFAKAENRNFSLEELANSLPEILGRIYESASHINRIIAGEDFSLVFQPIVSLKSRAIHHFEVLSRIEGGVESPAEFIQTAEDLSLIKGFDLAVVRNAIAWLKKPVNQEFQIPIAVNLSAISIDDAAFVDELCSLIPSLGEYRQGLLFEITESSKISDPEGANHAIQSLRRAGHKVCLDDFGVGEASLQYLRHFQVDVLKIDGSYVREALTDKTCAHILKAIADLCRKLEIETVAEMVEDSQTVKFLLDSGITYGQGWHFGKPSSDPFGAS